MPPLVSVIGFLQLLLSKLHSLALAVLFGLAEPQFELIPFYLASFGELAAKSHTGAGGTRDQPLPLVQDVAFDEAHEFAGVDNSCFGAKRRLPHRPQKIDLQLHRRETLICRERGVVREAHRCVSDVGQHASMESSGRVGVALISDEFDHSRSVFRLKKIETEKFADRRRK